MSIFAIGDIHGCSRALDVLLSAIPLGPEDTLVTLGDYGDRGPDTRGVIERLLVLRERYHLVALRGNHEVMMCKARQDRGGLLDWLAVGGEATLASYGNIAAIPASHWRFIEQECVDLFEAETHFFVHAGVHADLPLSDQPEYVLHWDRFRNPPPHESGKVMVCGHTSQKNGLPAYIGHAICIDTWACGEGWLSCLDVRQGIVWQANQAGESRRLWLDEIGNP